MNIFVTGGAGYIGSILVPKLLELGHTVVVLDSFKYRQFALVEACQYEKFSVIRGDARDESVLREQVSKADLIIPLAALVGAPLCDKFKKDAVSTNYHAIKMIRNLVTSKNKVIYMTSNSGYGIGEKNKYCDENSPLNPISLYGRTKCDAENILKDFKNSVSFRLATVFGISYRMRSDLLVNNFVFRTIKDKRLDIFEPNFRRNFIHVRDVVNAIIFTMKNFNKLKNDVYNLGLSSANISKIMLAKKIKKQYKKLKIKIVKNRKDPDKRDYFVSNKKIEKAGFKAKVTLEHGISELYGLFKNCDIKFINNY